MSSRTTAGAARWLRPTRRAALAAIGALAAFGATCAIFASTTLAASPPQTFVVLVGPNHNGYFTAPPTATLVATDPGGPGIQHTFYSLDSPTGPWTTYTGSFSINAPDGYHVLYFYSVDNNNVAEPVESWQVAIDTTAPVATSNVMPAPVGGTVEGPATVMLGATDNLSGVATIEYSVDGSPVQPYTGAFTISTTGAHVVTFYAVDVAGNMEALQTLNLQVDNPNGTVSVNGNVGSTLSLSLASTTPNLGFLVPGTAATYSTTTGATVISTAGSATLTASDPSSQFPGHLVNTTASGAPYELPQGLQVDATSTSASATGGGTFFNLANTNPATILSYNGPVANDLVTIGFQQVVGASDALRTGNYTKTITFTLSTATP